MPLTKKNYRGFAVGRAEISAFTARRERDFGATRSVASRRVAALRDERRLRDAYRRLAAE